VAGALWLVTSVLLSTLYRQFCDQLEKESDEKCNEIDKKFIATPVLGFFCFIGWVRSSLYACMGVCKQYTYWKKSHMHNTKNTYYVIIILLTMQDSLHNSYSYVATYIYSYYLYIMLQL